MSTDSNTTTLRGRLARDPHFTREDDAVKFAFFTVAASRPHTGRDGIATTATDYVDVKVFNTSIAAQLESGGLNKGALVTATGRGSAELSEYEKDGETKRRAIQTVIIENDNQGVAIESLGNKQDDTSSKNDIPA